MSAEINVAVFQTTPCSRGLIFADSSGLVNYSRYMNMFAGIYFCDLKIVANFTK